MDERDLRRAILVGTDDGVFRLSGGIGSGRWRSERVLDTHARSVRAIVFEPVRRALLVGVGGRGAGLLLSRDGGDVWRPAPGWPADRQAWSIAADETGRLLVGSEPPDVWQGTASHDGWVANESVRAIPQRSLWDFVRPPYTAHVLWFSQHPQDSRRWLAAVEQGGVVASDDAAGTWRQSSPLWDVHVVQHLGNGAALAATGGGMFRSADGGRSWSGPFGPRGYATGLTLDAGGTVWAAFRGASAVVYRSDDGGLVWQHVVFAEHVTEPGHGVHALVADPVLPGVLFHGAADGVWSIAGDTVRCICDGLPDVRRVFVLPEHSGRSFIVPGGGVAKP